MASLATIRIEIITDASKAAKGMDDTAAKTSSLGSKMKGLAAGVATGFAVTKVAAFGQATVQAATESQVATSRLEAVFKSMGDTTGNAAKSAEAYAGSLSRKIGVDDEVIMKGQAMLATFKDVSSETARSAGIFDRATAAGADLAAAGFGSIDSNAVQLGKALQDPIKGITALARSGVTFTAAQKASIAAMVKNNDLLGAQKVILAGVEQQVGGTAVATATAADKQKVAYGEMQEAIGNKLLPVIQQFQGVLMGLFDFIAANAGWLLPLVIGIAAAIIVLKGITLASQAVIAVNALMGASWFAAVWPIALIIVGILALIAIFVLLYNKCTWFRDIVQTVMRAAVVAFNWVLDAGKAVFNWIRSNWPLLLAILTGPIGVAVLLIAKNWDTIKAGAQSLFTFFGAIAGKIGNALSGVAHAISAPFIAGFNAVRGAVEDAIGWVIGRINSLKSAVGSAVNFAKGLYNSFAQAWNGIEIGIPRKEILGKTVPGTGVTWGLPDIPLLARGAYITRPMLGVFGEAGAEYALPERMLRAELARAGGNTYRIEVHVAAGANPAEVGRTLVDNIRAFERSAGASWRGATA